jgi:hypothetical protein
MVIATATEFYRVSPEKAFTGPFPNQADIMDIITADFDPEQVPKQSPKLIRMKPIKNPDSPTTLTVYRGELKGAPERKPEGGDTFIDTWVKDRKIDNRYEIDKARDTMRQLLAITKKPFPETLPLEALALAEKLGEKLSSASVQKRMSYLCAAFKAGLKYHLIPFGSPNPFAGIGNSNGDDALKREPLSQDDMALARSPQSGS